MPRARPGRTPAPRAAVAAERAGRPGARARPAMAPGHAVPGSAFAQFRAALGDRGLAVRGLVLVDDALARGLVQALRRGAHRHGRRLCIAGVRGLAELAHGSLQRRLDGLVAQPGLLVLLVALDL